MSSARGGRGSFRGAVGAAGTAQNGNAIRTPRAGFQRGSGNALAGRGRGATSRGGMTRGTNARGVSRGLSRGSSMPSPSSTPLPQSDFGFQASAPQGSAQHRYQLLKKQREVERAAAIRDGFLADPNRPRTLAEAITPVGTCQDMCAEFERLERIVQKDVWGPETGAATGSNEPSEQRMVKKFRRAAAGIDEQLPSDLRPPAVLLKTVEYLFDQVIGSADSLATVHHFVWDRTRAVRNDFSIQQITKLSDVRIAIDCYECIARFHILSLHQFAQPEKPYDKYDWYQEREQLDRTLLSLTQYYDDNKGRMQCPNESEFRAYCIVFQIQDPIPDLEDRVRNWDDQVKMNPRVRTALELYAAASNVLDPQGPLRARKIHPVAREDWDAFFKTVESGKVSYLMACVSEIYFNLVRKLALNGIWRAFRRQGTTMDVTDFTLDYLTDLLRFDNPAETEDFCEHYSFPFKQSAGQDSDSFLDLNAVKGKVFPEVSQGLQQQYFSDRVVESKRMGRTFPAIIRGMGMKDAEQAGMIVEETSEDQEMEMDDTEGDNDSLFVSKRPSQTIGLSQTQAGTNNSVFSNAAVTKATSEDAPPQQSATNPFSFSKPAIPPTGTSDGGNAPSNSSPFSFKGTTATSTTPFGSPASGTNTGLGGSMFAPKSSSSSPFAPITQSGTNPFAQKAPSPTGFGTPSGGSPGATAFGKPSQSPFAPAPAPAPSALSSTAADSNNKPVNALGGGLKESIFAQPSTRPPAGQSTFKFGSLPPSAGSSSTSTSSLPPFSPSKIAAPPTFSPQAPSPAPPSTAFAGFKPTFGSQASSQTSPSRLSNTPPATPPSTLFQAEKPKEPSNTTEPSTNVSVGSTPKPAEPSKSLSSFNAPVAPASDATASAQGAQKPASSEQKARTLFSFPPATASNPAPQTADDPASTSTKPTAQAAPTVPASKPAANTPTFSFTQPNQPKRPSPLSQSYNAVADANTSAPQIAKPTEAPKQPENQATQQKPKSTPSPAAKPTQPAVSRDQVLDRLSEEVVLDPSKGLLKQFVEYHTRAVIMQTFDQLHMDSLRELADNFRRDTLAARYGKRWRDTCWRLRLTRQGKEKREKRRNAARERAARDQKQAEMKKVDAVDEYLKQTHASNMSKRATIGSMRGSNEASRPSSTSIRRSRAGHQEAVDDQSSAVSEAPPSTDRALRRVSRIDQAGRIAKPSPPSSKASTSSHRSHFLGFSLRGSTASVAPPASRSTYFRLKALGIDPNRTATSAPSRKRSRDEDDNEADPNLGSPVAKNAKTHSSPEDNNVGLQGRTRSISAVSRSSVLSFSPAPSAFSLKRRFADQEEATEDIIARARAARRPKADGSVLNRSQVTTSGRDIENSASAFQASAHRAASTSSQLQHSGYQSGATYRNPDVPAYRLRESRFVPREDYPKALERARQTIEARRSQHSAVVDEVPVGDSFKTATPPPLPPAPVNDHSTHYRDVSDSATSQRMAVASAMLPAVNMDLVIDPERLSPETAGQYISHSSADNGRYRPSESVFNSPYFVHRDRTEHEGTATSHEHTTSGHLSAFHSQAPQDQTMVVQDSLESPILWNSQSNLDKGSRSAGMGDQHIASEQSHETSRPATISAVSQGSPYQAPQHSLETMYQEPSQPSIAGVDSKSFTAINDKQDGDLESVNSVAYPDLNGIRQEQSHFADEVTSFTGVNISHFGSAFRSASPSTAFTSIKKPERFTFGMPSQTMHQETSQPFIEHLSDHSHAAYELGQIEQDSMPIDPSLLGDSEVSRTIDSHTLMDNDMIADSFNSQTMKPTGTEEGLVHSETAKQSSRLASNAFELLQQDDGEIEHDDSKDEPVDLNSDDGDEPADQPGLSSQGGPDIRGFVNDRANYDVNLDSRNSDLVSQSEEEVEQESEDDEDQTVDLGDGAVRHLVRNTVDDAEKEAILEEEESGSEDEEDEDVDDDGFEDQASHSVQAPFQPQDYADDEDLDDEADDDARYIEQGYTQTLPQPQRGPHLADSANTSRPESEEDTEQSGVEGLEGNVDGYEDGADDERVGSQDYDEEGEDFDSGEEDDEDGEDEEGDEDEGEEDEEDEEDESPGPPASQSNLIKAGTGSAEDAFELSD